ncbi:MAG: DEAD/DEAH box helicase [Desulfurococcaceae archaeon]
MFRIYKDWLTIELDEYLEKRYPDSNTRVIYEKIEETSEPEHGPSIYEVDFPGELIKVLEKRNIRRLYKFQYEAYREILSGNNVIIVAGTGTGKTEAFFIPIAKKILTNTKQNPQVLVFYPTKALARDQVERFIEYSIYGRLGVNVYDGDTPANLRKRIAMNPPPIIVSNPDMLHMGLIYSPYIRRFVESAETMIFDELHVYEGVLGAHIHHLVHRIKLTRNRKTQFVASSATIGNPKEFAESLFEEDFKEIRGSLARKGLIVHILVSSGYMSRWSTVSAIAKFLVDNDLRFIIFVDSQQMAEILANIIESRYNVDIAVHRAGLPIEVRRDIENKLREGKITGVVATPTLELGIDIGALDAVVLGNLPPSYAKYLQRSGRAGRRKKGYVITVLGEEPIDEYYARNPGQFFNQKLTPNVIEPLNEEIIKLHFASYMLQVGKLHESKIPYEWKTVLDDLLAERIIKKIGPYISVNYINGRRYVTMKGGIRTQGDLVEIIDANSDRVIALRELPEAVLELYPGAIYFCAKKPYEVIELNMSDRKAYVKEVVEEQKFYTKPLYEVDVVDFDIISERESDLNFKTSYAKVLVKISVNGFIVKDIYAGKIYSTRSFLEPVVYEYVTKALLIKLPILEEYDEHDFAEAFHALEHALIEASRITCGAGVTDLGGISYPSGDIVIYDAAVGGSGISKLLYSKLEETMNIAYDLMAKCDCIDGCPKCIFSPYCGNNNKVLSKKKALRYLDFLYSRKIRPGIKPLEEKYGKPLV